MNVNISEVSEICCGKKYVIIDNFKFSEFRLNKVKIKCFCCTNCSYNITTKISNNLKLVIFINGKHNHKALKKETKSNVIIEKEDRLNVTQKVK